MFGFSLTKLLLLVAVVTFVIFAFKIAARRSSGVADEADEPATVDTEYDRDTDTYVVRDRERRDGE
jgi:hypothetical protein